MVINFGVNYVLTAKQKNNFLCCLVDYLGFDSDKCEFIFFNLLKSNNF